ncbi:MAG: helix-turn-helix transcriptional regulator, partial [Ignavibacteriae bacterium]|nr:helix-turn-helix transcriptional regulator [Ignavibacteriota bacterium]
HSVKWYCLIKLGHYKEAQNYPKMMPDELLITGDKIGMTALTLTMKKDYNKALILIQKLLDDGDNPDSLRANLFMYLFYAIKGDVQNTFKWANLAIKNNASLLLLHFNNPLSNPIKNDPKYFETLNKLFPLFITDEEKKKKKDLLDHESSVAYTKQLLEYIEKEKPYLDPKLSLRSLAKQIDIHPNQLSWLLNESIGKNFSEFINHYRIETFKEIAKSSKYSHISLIGLAYESGFNSKTVFNTFFKKETGLTPNQYIKLQQ